MIHGLLVTNKIKDITSHDVVDRVRKIFGTKKVGHFGTLDPFAEGVLLVGIGHTTKFFNFYIKKKKRYCGIIQFGHATSTYDGEGEPVSPVREIDLNQVNLQAIMAEFSGKIQQIPPIYSAKKYKGKPLYKYARQSRVPKIKPVEVEIFSLQWEIAAKNQLAFNTLTSSGTYIRSLAHDIGQRVGVGAFLLKLKREGIGEFELSSAVELGELEKCSSKKDLMRYVRPIESLLPEFPKIICSGGGREAVLHGRPLLAKDVEKVIDGEDESHFRLFDSEGKLLAIARKAGVQKAFQPFIVFNS
jgi:tRNA pseudouridine55 synthase